MTGYEWVYLVIMLLGAAYAYSNQPKTPQPIALTMEDIKIPVVEIGKPIPVVFGTRDINDPEVCWYGDLRTSPVRASSGK